MSNFLHPEEMKMTASPKISRPKRPALFRGDDLKRLWGIPAKEVRFHREGKFYGLLTRFPAALCDLDGYVLFETEQDLMSSPHTKIGKRLNVPGTISKIPGYVRKPT